MLHIGHQREELDIELEGKILNQRDSFVYLGGAVCGDGKTERDIRRRVQAAANAWRAVDGVMADRRFSKRLKDKFMSTCVTLARLYGTETLAVTELQQHRLQVCENNWVRKIVRVYESRQGKNGAVKGRDGSVKALDRETGEEQIAVGWTRRRMAGERLPKRATVLREQGRIVG